MSCRRLGGSLGIEFYSAHGSGDWEVQDHGTSICLTAHESHVLFQLTVGSRKAKRAHAEETEHERQPCFLLTFSCSSNPVLTRLELTAIGKACVLINDLIAANDSKFQGEFQKGTNHIPTIASEKAEGRGPRRARGELAVSAAGMGTGYNAAKPKACSGVEDISLDARTGWR
jgi:hypothetical protein